MYTAEQKEALGARIGEDVDGFVLTQIGFTRDDGRAELIYERGEATQKVLLPVGSLDVDRANKYVQDWSDRMETQ